MPAYITKSTPMTYIIDQSYHLDCLEETIEKIREAPPMLYHVGYDTAYPSYVGATYPLEEARERSDRARWWVEQVHAAGVDIFIGRICNQTILDSDPDKRTGIWWFYDHWEDYAEDVGPKPEADPIEWMQREPDGRLHFNYPYRFAKGGVSRKRFAPCQNNPYWHDWLKRVVTIFAEYGFDGVFIDNNILHCHCEHCQREFRTYLTQTYTPSQRRRRFGTDDVSKLRLSTLGDKVLWASSQREYLEWIRENEPGEFREKFGTDDVDAAIASEAGNGFHWGRAHNFWLRKLNESHTPEEVDRILREGDISSLGITTPEERCLWADTQKFWAWSIGRRNSEIREAASKVRPGFLMVPNWGDMAGFRTVDSRRLEAKNIRLWKPGADIMFFEQEYLPSKLAPGYVFDLVVPYKYSTACGMRTCALPYRGGEHRALNELAAAEATAWTGDGMFVTSRYRFPELRRAYRVFYERHVDWFVGRRSYSDVGLIFSFDEIHMENTHHMREVYSLAHYLVDHHIMFDFLNEEQISLPELNRFDLVIVPHVQFLPAAARRSLLRYLEGGGRLLVTGNTGAYDGDAKPSRKRDLLAMLRNIIRQGGRNGYVEHRSNGAIIWIDDIYSWLPRRRWQIHDLADFNLKALLEGVIDDVIEASGNEPSDDPRLARLLDKLAGRRLKVLGAGTPATIRVAAWHRDRPRPSTVIHLVNYNVPGTKMSLDADAQQGDDVKVTPAENIEVVFPLPDNTKVSQVLQADPWNPEPEPLPFRCTGGRVRFTVPYMDIYRVIWIG